MLLHEKSNLMISKAEFGLNEVLCYSSKVQNFYGILLGSPWIWEGKFNYSVLNVSLKCLLLT